MTRDPGVFTTSPAAVAAMESESLPPSIAMPTSIMASRMASAQSYMAAPSPSILAAHIQLPDALIFLMSEMRAKHMLVKHSATDILAIAAASRNPLIGCSPIEQAAPVVSKCDLAMTATSARGSWSGPTHCCWATNPVTARSTLLVRKRLEQTEGSCSTLLIAACTVVSSGSSSGTRTGWVRVKWYVLLGMEPNTFSNSKSSGQSEPSGARESTTVTRPDPVISPTTEKGSLSLAQMVAMVLTASGRMSMASFSWYSAPQRSSTLIVASPTFSSRILITPPSGSMSSFSTLQLPPAPWS
mmetsp:Transcript_29817/g.41208  ORF Transcript_29817/g.41208 Transcript_29817/m.41208 type:complete len:299 (+) Transcript_29817:1772-2668(+)